MAANAKQPAVITTVSGFDPTPPALQPASTTTTTTAPLPVTPPQRKVKVRTTLPFSPLPPLATRQPLETERLRLVPITQDLLPDYHWIRTQPEYMVNSRQGRPDRDLAETQKWMDRFVPPGDQHTYTFAIKMKKEPSAAAAAAEGEEAAFESRAIGMMGIVRMNRGTGWPEIGYGINNTHHGRGYATELLREVLKFWWSLPREEVVVEMDAKYVFGTAEDGDGGHAADKADGIVVDMPERVMAIADVTNLPSLRVMEKVGFTQFASFVFEDDDPPLPVVASWLLRPA
ncbi:GNAT domain-containing protein [Microdochium trichocladiopsis]|uniref:GNAT domain-containing protein n=1 Tax=Microdochium trichocladiopsis TaxID=1682393 RepID=A0A9P8YK56_9PEZI|nr:GNAT domain-containing protein [Microdochium trichocladiopsis]KAH7040936.1 GNAT domain-containing protein [Microdochium trichocladiopsis]